MTHRTESNAPSQPSIVRVHLNRENLPERCTCGGRLHYEFGPGDYMSVYCGRCTPVVDVRVKSSISPSQPAPAPDALRLGELLRAQDNRCTANPVFAVQQKRRIWGVEEGDGHEWRKIDEWEAVDAEKAAELERHFDIYGEVKEGFHRYCYLDVWEFVTACLTEQGCEDYIAINGHNLHEPRIYAYGGYRNAEWQFTRKYFMGLTTPAAPTGEPSGVGPRTAELLQILSPGEPSGDDAWARKVAGVAVQALADSDPDGPCIEAQDLLQGTAAESYFVVSAATLEDIVYCAISNQLYDDQRFATPDSEPSADECARCGNSGRVVPAGGFLSTPCPDCAPVPATGMETSDG